MTPAALYWLFTLAFTVHNIEEGLFLPAYAADESRIAGRITPFALRFALVVLTAGMFMIAAFAAAGVHSAIELLAAVAAVMVVNALVPHLTLTVAFRRYAPGTGTAVFLVVPLSLLVITDGFATNMLTMRSLLVATATVAVTLLAVIPLLFWAGHAAERRLPWLSADSAT